jgi:hypothetical protein
MELTWILIFIFAFCTIVFLAVALFLPEWVGISRNDSSQEKSHQKEITPQSTEGLGEHLSSDE